MGAEVGSRPDSSSLRRRGRVHDLAALEVRAAADPAAVCAAAYAADSIFFGDGARGGATCWA